MGCELVIRVITQVSRHDLDTVEVFRPLFEVEDLRSGRTVLDPDRRERIVPLASDRCADLVRRDAEDSRERADLVQSHTAALRQVRRPDLDCASGNVRHEDVAVAIEDRAPRRLHADVSTLVVLRRAQKLLAVQDLQRPEPEKERCEDRESQHAENSDAQGKLRREPVGLCGVRVRRQEAAREAALSQGDAPLSSPIRVGAAAGV